jgi:hypothetical protein
MLLDFDDGWELHVRVQIHSMAAGPPGKKQARYSIRHTHANVGHQRTLFSGYLGWEWLCRDVPSLGWDVVKCRVCGDIMPAELHGSMKLISWSVKNED